MANVQYASNKISDFEEGGLYPGGSGVIEDIKYVLWDYDGKQAPDSVIAVYMKFQPNDGSNEGKPVDNYWAAGNDVKSFSPDPTGGHLLITGSRKQQSRSSNWAHVLEMFDKNCGLDENMLAGTEGIRALLNTQLTLARVDQKERTGLERAPGTPDKKQFKPTLLIPTKAKFPWEKGAKAAAKSAAASTTATASTPAASATTNGAPTTDLSLLIKEIVTTAGGSIEYAALPKELLGKLADVDRTARTAIIKDAKDPAKIAALAEENGWTFSGSKDGEKLSGELVI